MAEKKDSQDSKSHEGFSKEEIAAMKARAKELKSKTDGTADVLAAIAELPKEDRDLAERIHAIVTANGPDLTPRTYYGMPAWAKDGKVLCFFSPASKFKTRYASLGFEQPANLDDGSMWPTSWALTRLTAADEKKIAALVKKAVS